MIPNDLAENPASCAEWTLQVMAVQCGTGITAMSKCCHELVNTDPVAFLNQCRLDHAARGLLDKRDTSATAVVMAAGFNSSQYFATLFQKRFQIPPTDFRNRSEE